MKKSWLIPAMLGSLVTAVVFALALLVAEVRSDDDSASAAKQSSSAAPALDDEPEPVEETTPPVELEPSDFMLEAKVTERTCFGSAGCNVTYRVEPTYLGDLSELPDATVEITFEVTGPNDGPQIGTISLADGQYDIEDRIAGTRSAKTPLRVKITDVNTY